MPDTWRTGERVAEIETLCVAPAARGAGSARRCWTGSTPSSSEGVRRRADRRVVTNTDAIRLYERRGFRPAWLYMLRLGGRSA